MLQQPSRLPAKPYARHDATLARSLIGQMLGELMLAWSDYQQTNGTFIKRDSLRTQIAAAQAQLDAPVVANARAVPLVLPDALIEAAEDSRLTTWIGWMRHAAVWYALAIETDYVRRRPALASAMLALAQKHIELVTNHPDASAWHGTHGAAPMGPAGRREKREAAMVAGR